MSPAIRIESLSKLYRINHQSTTRGVGYRLLRDDLVDLARAPFRRLRRAFHRDGSTNGQSRGAPPDEDFWALKDVSFDVQPGEVVGIIGRNGAGKSTLLKILSRITPPTSGRVMINGRVGSLLEVGTGFHPELTGRENVFMNGSVLGMSHQEIQRRFDEIVDFSGVEKFLDTPVKRYSSGMYVRLAFAVAAHLEPEILIVDEVLAVGDSAFQTKCIRRMRDVAQKGRTVLFVSHNIAAVQALCTRGVLIANGMVTMNGSTGECIAHYSRELQECVLQPLCGRTDRKGNQNARIVGVSLRNQRGEPTAAVEMGAQFTIEVQVHCDFGVYRPVCGIAVKTAMGQRLFGLHTVRSGVTLPDMRPSSDTTIKCRVDELPLLPGLYTITVGIADGFDAQIDHIDSAASFEVTAADVFGTGKVPAGPGDLLFVRSEWN